MRRKLTYAVVAVWICASVFCVLHVSTTLGERWIWQVHDFEYSNGTISKGVKLESGDYDVYSQPTRVIGDIPREIEALPGYSVLHEAEVFVAAGLCLLFLNWNTTSVQRFRSELPQVLKRWSPTITGLTLIAPLLWVPCTYTRTLYYAGRTVFFSEYRWLWQVGTGKVQITTIFLEELIIGFFFYFASIQLRRMTAS